MKFYHGNPSPRKLKKIKKLCPSLNHRIEWTPYTIVKKDSNYFLDNGAFTKEFNPDKWIKTLDWIKKMEYSPDFVVLPDLFDDPQETDKLHREYIDEVNRRDFNSYYVAQRGSEAKNIVEKALNLNCKGIFVGGSWHKPRIMPSFIREANKNNLLIHIGMPKDFYWAYQSGADSFDSVSIVRNQAWDRLRNLENKIKFQKKIVEEADS